MSWLNLSAIVVGALVRLLKSDKLDSVLASYNLPAIPKRLLPWISLALGVAGGVIAALMHKMDWAQALQDGVVSGALATAGHELVIESLLDGKEPMAAKLDDPPPSNDIKVIQ